ncbi:DeoD-type purine-nucleoside phosphorylase [Galbitalea soli]|uniref:Uridine phosphorylase n=1 Tax=Galbitalea soli TaxID=1268042 RepID=A0A7C9PP67_9MICO|nr:purine-nucleoside phosphorylase [Galbitalea soli]NEM92067.1 purine-nucleoside phosphorylase [Galbitalea soli]NYJ31981.1 purine-nucleoside phosphorylase [Galbitalea soli]
MPTPHIAAAEGEIAPKVIMPGDPRRATLIAEQFFDDARLVTEVRGILGYTGTVGGERMTVMASGMGMPSLTIYATELVRSYGVTRIVRVGTMGGAQDFLELGDVVAASAAHTDSAMSAARIPGVQFSHAPTFGLLRAAVEYGEASGTTLHVGPVFTTDAFYQPNTAVGAQMVAHGVLGIEMEAAGLYAVGAAEGIETLMVGTVSDFLYKKGEMSPAERESTFAGMVPFAIAALQS